MHEFSLMTGVLDAVEASAKEHKAHTVVEIKLVVGDMTEVLEDAMDFAFEALAPGTIAEGAKLTMTRVMPRSRCTVCGTEFEHTRYSFACPNCDSLATELLAGRELYIDSMEVEQ